MNYIGPRRNSRSYDAERKSKDPESSVNYFLKTPTGILLQGLLAKGFAMHPNKDREILDVYNANIDDFRLYNKLESLDNLTDSEKFKLIEALHKYNVYKYRILLGIAKHQRDRDIEKSEYTVDDYYQMHKGHKYPSTIDLKLLELERKKKSVKSKSKRKPVKRCRCSK